MEMKMLIPTEELGRSRAIILKKGYMHQDDVNYHNHISGFQESRKPLLPVLGF
jgi:hypothetical protein